MKKLSLLVAVFFLFTGLSFSQQNNNQQNCNIKLDAKEDYRPNFKFINSHPKVFKDDIPQINLLKSKFNTSFNNYKCYKKYFNDYRIKKTVANSYSSRSRQKRELKKAQKDSLTAINYYMAAIRLCMQSYPKYNEILKSRYALLLAQHQNKLKNARFKNLIDSITNLLIKRQEEAKKINQELSKLKDLKQLNRSILLCKKYKEISSIYLDLIQAIIGNDNEVNKLYQKYKIPKPTNTNASTGQQQLQTTINISPFLIDIKPENAETFLKLTNNDQKKLQNALNILNKIKKNELKINYSNDDFIREAVSAYLAELYYTAYKQLFEIYYPAIVYKKDLMNKINNDACHLYKLYNQTGDKVYLWQAANLYAYGVNIEEYEISRQYTNIDTTYYIPRFTEVCASTVRTASNVIKPSKTTTKPTPGKNKSITLCKSLYSYTINNPQPKKIYERGTYYRVYVAMTKNNLVTTIWKDYLPIYYIPICNSSLKKFYVGKYKTFDQANRAANEIKAKFKINFVKVVKFVNGKPVKIYNIRKVSPRHTSASANSGTVYNIANTTSLTYLIRLGTYSSPKKPGDIAHLKNLYYEKTTDGKYIYYDGPYYKFSNAAEALRKIKALGYGDAYIRAFYKGKLIDINTARKLENSSNTAVSAQYGVQIGSYKHPLTPEEFNKIYGKINTYNIKYTKHLNRYKYYIPAKDYKTAKSILKQIKSKGFTDAFIIKIEANNISTVK